MINANLESRINMFDISTFLMTAYGINLGAQTTYTALFLTYEAKGMAAFSASLALASMINLCYWMKKSAKTLK